MKVSIITTSYNSCKTIEETIKSVQSQTYEDVEHIIVDGGSNDQTMKILKRYPNKNKKICPETSKNATLRANASSVMRTSANGSM